MTQLLRDVRFGIRMLVKSPGLSLVAVLTLALGIGLTSTMFSIVKGVVLSELPFEEGGRILYLGTHRTDRNIETTTVSLHSFIDWRSRQTSFEDLAAFQQTTFNLSGDDRPERIRGAHLTAAALPLLRTAPLLGRVFSTGEDTPGAAPVVLLGERIWRTRYRSDPQILGRTIRVDGVPAAVIGVLPEDFKFPVHEEIWLPLRLDPGAVPRGSGPQLDVFGRLRDGVSQEKALAELRVIAQALEQEHPGTNRGESATTGPYTKKYVNAQAASLLYVMLGVVGLVLLLACANVATLLMARASGRTRELALRSVLGAGRRGVIVQILVESLILSLAGALPGLLLAMLGIEIFNAAIVDASPPFWFDTSLDLRLLLVLLAACGGSGLLSGLVPALQASKVETNSILKDAGRGSTGLRIGRFTRGVVAFEVALSCALLVGSGLMIKSILQVRQIDLGFDKTGLLTAGLNLDATRYPEPGSQMRFVDLLLQGLRTEPGVAAAAVADTLPTETAPMTFYAVEGQAEAEPASQPRAHRARVSAGYFSTLGAAVQEGRELTSEDRPESLPVVVVNESFARRAWPDASPLNRRIRLGRGNDEPWRTVVGVVPDLWMNGFDRSARPDGIYLPLAQAPAAGFRLVVRAAGDPVALTPSIRQRVAQLDRGLPLDSVQTMERVVSRNAFAFNLFGALFGLFGLAALLLASVGIYGVVAFSVQQRTREIGIRISLGAQRRDILSLLLGQGARQVAAGLGVGLLLAWGVSRLIGSFLFEVQPGDPAVFLSVTLLLAGVALCACLVPARRAMRVDPQVSLRYE